MGSSTTSSGNGIIVNNKKISASSARAHTRKTNQNSSFQLSPGMLRKLIGLFFVGILSYAYQAIQPPPPKLCGSPGGPPITAPRIKLRDGRHLAYKELGVPKESAKYKIVFIHGFDSCRHDNFAKFLSPDLVQELGVYVVSFDKPGYGESDPHPKRTVKCIALDIEELADQLGLGSKFYVVGFSMGGQAVWSVLKYIPHRLAGAALIAPVANYWWTGFPSNISKQAYDLQLLNDQWAVSVAHHAPWLVYWWNSQKWFPSSSAIAHNPAVFSTKDMELVMKPHWQSRMEYAAYIRQQGVQESLNRDMILGFGKWEFSPLDLANPFPNNEGSVHLWHGDDDQLVPVLPQRYIVQQLPWIHYHEMPGDGHLLHEAEGVADTILKELLLQKK
uniref:AB hydrolase-1 domain-containing protein n=2 Tax=Cannabis sativa TaxID=3483 RepID=A0A803R0Q7_CANSA